MRHDAIIAAHIRLELDNAVDDMHDDGILDEWVNLVAAPNTMHILRTMLSFRHRMNCSNPAEMVTCASCAADGTYDMHYLMCDNQNECAELITTLVYSPFIRPRWEDEPKMGSFDI